MTGEGGIVPIGNANYVLRDTQLVEFAELDPEKVRTISCVKDVHLRFATAVQSIDYGSRCFSRRRVVGRSKAAYKSTARLVDLESFEPYRSFWLQSVLAWLVDAAALGTRTATSENYTFGILRFLDWLDAERPRVLVDAQDLVSAYADYSTHVLQRARRDEISINTASAYQECIRVTLESTLDDSDVVGLRSVIRIVRDPTLNVPTQPPAPERAASYILRLSKVLALTEDFLQIDQPYPYTGKLGSKSVCLLPVKHSPVVYFDRAEARENGLLPPHRHHSGFNFVTGEVSTAEEVRRLSDIHRSTPMSDGELMHRRRDAANLIEKSNADPLSPPRVRLLRIYLTGSAMMFVCATGMNVSQVRQLKMSSFKVEKARVSFSARKSRAGGRLVTFTVGKYYRRVFLQYLEIRKATLLHLGLRDVDHVFFEMHDGAVRPLGRSPFGNFHNSLRQAFEIDMHISAKEWRVFKGAEVLSKYGPTRAAEMLQNELGTYLKHYTEPSVEAGREELSKFLIKYDSQLVASVGQDSADISIGRCLKVGAPRARGRVPTAVEPDCRDAGGCLFCEQYRVHADAKDVRKLLSYEWVLAATGHLRELDVPDQETTKRTVSRIRKVLRVISQNGGPSSDEIKDMRSEVSGSAALTPTWRRKIEMLVDLDVL